MEENREVKPVRRRRHSAAFKAEAVRACMHPGVSIAAVALHYRLNANLLRRWVANHEMQGPDADTPVEKAMPIQPAGFVPLQLNLPDAAASTPDIVIEIRRGAAMVTVRWPASAAAECATWLQGCGDPHRCRLAGGHAPGHARRNGHRSGACHHRLLWSYCSTALNPMKAVVFDFAESRGGRHAEQFLGTWRGTLVCDDFSGYKVLFRQGVTEAGCMAHARRKFHELWANHSSQIAGEALKLFGALDDVEREIQTLDVDQRRDIRLQQTRPAADALHVWLLAQRERVPEGSATAKAINYSLGRWGPLTRYLDDGHLPIDNNWVENQIRPIAIGRHNWLFAGSLRAGQRAAAIMSLIHSARLNGHDVYAYLKDVLERLPSQPASRVGELFPHRWSSAQ